MSSSEAVEVALSGSETVEGALDIDVIVDDHEDILLDRLLVLVYRPVEGSEEKFEMVEAVPVVNAERDGETHIIASASQRRFTCAAVPPRSIAEGNVVEAVARWSSETREPTESSTSVLVD